jgi:membrane associated rhomboid family serine protease
VIPLGDELRRRRFPVVMLLILAANLLAFAYEWSLRGPALEQLVRSAGVIPAEYVAGQDLPPPAPAGIVYLTVLSAMFLHGGLLHLGSNMLYLLVFGDNVEGRLGHLGFALFYLLCGLIASAVYIYVNAGSQVPSVGASGAIAGVLAGYLVQFPQARIRTLVFLGPFILVPRIAAVFLIGFWFVTQLLSGLGSLGATTEQTTGVAFWAHIGGFVAGLVLVNVFRLFAPSSPEPARSAATSGRPV